MTELEKVRLCSLEWMAVRGGDGGGLGEDLEGEFPAAGGDHYLADGAAEEAGL